MATNRKLKNEVSSIDNEVVNEVVNNEATNNEAIVEKVEVVEVVDNDVEVVNEVNEVEIDVDALMKELGTKSAVIRKLSHDGMSRGAIAKLLNIRYQHVRNVLITPLKKK